MKQPSVSRLHMGSIISARYSLRSSSPGIPPNRPTGVNRRPWKPIYRHFSFDEKTNASKMVAGGKPVTAFLFKLISQLQFGGTVPMIDVQAIRAMARQIGIPTRLALMG